MSVPAVAVVAAASLVCAAIAERIVHAMVSSVWHMTVGFSDDEAAFSFAAVQLVTTTVSSANRFVVSILNALLGVLVGAASWLVTLTVLLVVTGVLFIAYEQYPVLARGFIIRWNGDIGPRLSSFIVLPVQALDLAFGAVLPVYNTVVWIATRVVSESVLKPFLTAPGVLLKLSAPTVLFARSSARSLSQYSHASFGDLACSGGGGAGNISLMACGAGGAYALDSGSRSFDVITPLTHLRDAAAITTMWVGTELCSHLAAPLDILLAPLMDINFAKAVHNLVNAALWTVVQVPIVTEARCRLFKHTDGIAMCLPDFEPSIRFLVEGLRRLGQTADNWLDVAVLVMQELVAPGSTPRCVCPRVCFVSRALTCCCAPQV